MQNKSFSGKDGMEEEHHSLNQRYCAFVLQTLIKIDAYLSETSVAMSGVVSCLNILVRR